MHPAARRCSSVEYSQYSPSSRLDRRAPRPSRCNAGLPPRAAGTCAVRGFRPRPPKSEARPGAADCSLDARPTPPPGSGPCVLAQPAHDLPSPAAARRGVHAAAGRDADADRPGQGHRVRAPRARWQRLPAGPGGDVRGRRRSPAARRCLRAQADGGLERVAGRAPAGRRRVDVAGRHRRVDRREPPVHAGRPGPAQARARAGRDRPPGVGRGQPGGAWRDPQRRRRGARAPAHRSPDDDGARRRHVQPDPRSRPGQLLRDGHDAAGAAADAAADRRSAGVAAAGARPPADRRGSPAPRSDGGVPARGGSRSHRRRRRDLDRRGRRLLRRERDAVPLAETGGRHLRRRRERLRG